MTDICELAMVSRSSFYSHFEDKYHLLLFCLEEIKQEINQKIDYSQKQFIIENVLEYILANNKLFKTLAATETSLELRRMLDQVFTEEVAEFLQTKDGQLGGEEHKLILKSIFLAGGITHVVQWWIGSNFQLSIAEMTGFISNSFED